MGMHEPPIAVRIIGWVYILTGVLGFVAHFGELNSPNPRNDAVWVELVSLIAIVSGAYLLRGHNWACWLALGWIGFHVVLSFFHTRFELAIHVLFLAILAYFLFRPVAARYFQIARG